MGLIKEAKNIDLVIHSEPWSEEELNAFRKIMGINKSKAAKKAIAKKNKRTKHSA
jgi:hypothetical protein